MKERKEYIRTYQAKWIKARRSAWLNENGPCAYCSSAESLEVDHVDPKTKVSSHVWSWSDDRLRAELEKCQVLCRKCHRVKSARECAVAYKGRPNVKARKHSDKLLKKLIRLYKSGMSQREASSECGLSRSVLSDILYRGYRADLLGSTIIGRGPAC